MASLIIFAHCLITIDDVVHNVIEISSRTKLAKIAVKSAFCLIPVIFLAMEWSISIFIGICLPFALYSARSNTHACASIRVAMTFTSS